MARPDVVLSNLIGEGKTRSASLPLDQAGLWVIDVLQVSPYSGTALYLRSLPGRAWPSLSLVVDVPSVDLDSLSKFRFGSAQIAFAPQIPPTLAASVRL